MVHIIVAHLLKFFVSDKIYVDLVIVQAKELIAMDSNGMIVQKTTLYAPN